MGRESLGAWRQVDGPSDGGRRSYLTTAASSVKGEQTRK